MRCLIGPCHGHLKHLEDVVGANPHGQNLFKACAAACLKKCLKQVLEIGTKNPRQIGFTRPGRHGASICWYTINWKLQARGYDLEARSQKLQATVISYTLHLENRATTISAPQTAGTAPEAEIQKKTVPKMWSVLSQNLVPNVGAIRKLEGVPKKVPFLVSEMGPDFGSKNKL